MKTQTESSISSSAVLRRVCGEQLSTAAVVSHRTRRGFIPGEETNSRSSATRSREGFCRESRRNNSYSLRESNTRAATFNSLTTSIYEFESGSSLAKRPNNTTECALQSVDRCHECKPSIFLLLDSVFFPLQRKLRGISLRSVVLKPPRG